MSLAKPTSDDEEPPGDNDNESSVTEQDAGQKATSSEESKSQEAMANRRSIAKLQKAVNANSSEIQSKAEATEVERLQRLVDELLERLTDLEEDYQSLHNYLSELERNRSGRMETMTQNTETIKELSAAVFDDNPECPECRDGHLQNSEPWLSNQLVCSNNKCGFERKIGKR